MLVDSHCHLDFPDFAEDLDAIVARAETAGIGRIVTISTRVKRLGGLLAIAERFPNVYCSVGTHPHQADEEDGIPAGELIELTKHPKVVALGEAGLDYFYDNGSPQAQARGRLSGPQPVRWPAAASKAARSTTTRTCVPRATSPAGSATENQNVSRRPSTPSSRAVAVTTAPTGVGAT